jgi:hypothetical protein
MESSTAATLRWLVVSLIAEVVLESPRRCRSTAEVASQNGNARRLKVVLAIAAIWLEIAASGLVAAAMEDMTVSRGCAEAEMS